VPFALAVSTLPGLPTFAADDDGSFVNCLRGRPVIVLEEIKDQKPTFDPPFQYTGPYVTNSYKRSLGSLFLYGHFGINVISADPSIGVWMCNSSCGPILIGNAKLSGNDKEVLTQAALKLSEDEIADLIKSPNPVKRATAIWALTQSGEKKHLSTVIHQLEDKDPLVRLYTLHGIGILGDGSSAVATKVRAAPAPEFQPEGAKSFFEEVMETVLTDTLKRLSSAVRAQSNDKPTVAVVPINLATIKEKRNKVVTGIAKLLGDKLSKDSAFSVMSQKEIAEALQESKLSYDDLKIKSFDELVKALATDVLLVVGPHPDPKEGDDGWLKIVVFRSFDKVGKSSRSLITDGKIEIEDPEFFAGDDDVESYRATITELLTQKK